MVKTSNTYSSSEAMPSIVILGGGTAGWMTANLMIQQWPNAHITLVESPNIPTIGVGEGSTPQLKTFFDKIDVTEQMWMPACNATYKNGILFKNWSTRAKNNSYFHPFTSLIDAHTAPAFSYNALFRRQGIDVECHPDRFFLSAHLAKHQQTPIGQYQFPFDISYGYHFDAALLGNFLNKVAVKKGVKHIRAEVASVKLQTENVSKNKAINALVLKSGEEISGEFFVDCSGFNGKLIQETLQVPFISFKENLFNDSAVAIQVPYPENVNSVASQTISTALTHGWMWQIPLMNRTGNGYVYSSDYCSAEQAESELRSVLNLSEEYPAKHLKMKVGRVEQNWYSNCLAVGLSQGFIEPLEATALHFVQETIEGFIEAFEQGGYSNANQRSFNQAIAARFEGIRDYIVGHYRLSDRTDSEYWRKNSENPHISNNLKRIVGSWINGENLDKFLNNDDVVSFYPPVSWHAMLVGYSVLPPLQPNNKFSPSMMSDAHKYDLAHIDQFITRSASNFDDHFSYLNGMYASETEFN